MEFTLYSIMYSMGCPESSGPRAQQHLTAGFDRIFTPMEDRVQHGQNDES